VIEFLRKEFDVTLFFYNPNIDPEEEYLFRLDEIRGFSREFGINLISGPYDKKTWQTAVSGLEGEPEGGKRCEVCFHMRLKKTADLSQDRSNERFTTTLTVSPHKNSAAINIIGSKVGKKGSYYPGDFKKNNGFQKSVELAKLYKLKRQNYCGCLFSRKK